jgi:ATP-dependent helicase YprA (DUF1998 family)
MAATEKAKKEILEGYMLSLPKEILRAKASLMAKGKSNEEAEKILADDAYEGKANRELDPEAAKKAFLEKIKSYNTKP